MRVCAPLAEARQTLIKRRNAGMYRGAGNQPADRASKGQDTIAADLLIEPAARQG